jgi:hypothetical protein
MQGRVEDQGGTVHDMRDGCGTSGQQTSAGEFHPV